MAAFQSSVLLLISIALWHLFESDDLAASPDSPKQKLEAMLRIFLIASSVPCLAQFALVAAMVLVVDDHADTCRAIQVLLAGEGVEAACLSDPTKAIDVIRRTQPELLILDYHMPRLNGLEVLAELRRTPPPSRIDKLPAIIFSSDSDTRAQNEAQRLGAIDWVRKGHEGWDRLRALVRATLGS